jgi:cyclic pyranopterin phosphate synthase
MSGMVDVGGKIPTARRAVASGRLKMGAAAFRLLKARKLPKGDALAMGEAAGILAAKRTPEAIPLCHTLSLDSVKVRFELKPNFIVAYCEVRAFARTGVEMEALSGVSGALLAVYDLVKQVDPKLTISDVKLDLKTGGKSGRQKAKGKAVVITVSDRSSAGRRKDTSGPLLRDGLKALGLTVAALRVVPDEPSAIRDAVLAAARKADVVALTGGTGLSPRDRTPETVAPLCRRLIPGLGEALRSAGARLPTAALSRSLAGQVGDALVLCLPGSNGGVRDALAVLELTLPHALHVARGGDHR